MTLQHEITSTTQFNSQFFALFVKIKQTIFRTLVKTKNQQPIVSRPLRALLNRPDIGVTQVGFRLKHRSVRFRYKHSGSIPVVVDVLIYHKHPWKTWYYLIKAPGGSARTTAN